MNYSEFLNQTANLYVSHDSELQVYAPWNDETYLVGSVEYDKEAEVLTFVLATEEDDED